MADVEKNTTAVAVATPADNGTPMWQQEKQGAKCCGCCCDYRRATIVISIIFIVLSLITVIGSVASAAVLNTFPQDDDELVDIVEKSNKTNAIITGISLLGWIAGLVGAMKYNVNLVAVNIVWMVIAFIVGIVISMGVYNDINDAYEGDEEIRQPVPQIVINAIFTALFIYPQVGLIMEIKNGIMSEATYPREEFSCCCVAQRR